MTAPEQSHLSDKVQANLRLRDVRIVEWYFQDDGNPTLLGPSKVSKGEAKQCRADGCLILGDDEFPISLHLTVPIVSSFMAEMGDHIRITIERTTHADGQHAVEDLRVRKSYKSFRSQNSLSVEKGHLYVHDVDNPAEILMVGSNVDRLEYIGFPVELSEIRFDKTSEPDVHNKPGRKHILVEAGGRIIAEDDGWDQLLGLVR